VVQEYIGGGVLGRLAAQLDESERRQREEETAYWREERERLEQNAAFVRELEEAAEILSQAYLIAAGFHIRRVRMEEASTWIWRLGCRMASRIG
jgi:hypothetical protein